MSDDLLTVQLTIRQARAVSGAAQLFSDTVADMNPEWTTHLEQGESPALFTGILAIELALALGAAA